MNVVIGVLRISAAIFVILAGVVLIFLTTLLPFKVHRARASIWIVVYLSRLFNLIFNVHVNCTDIETLRRHEGFIFVNHMSYLESLALLSLTPVRFLAAAEMRMRPVIGWITEQIGTIFVKREDKESRSMARQSIERVVNRSRYPPFVIYPEGRLGLGDRVNPFHPGSFEVACLNGVPYLVCALHFNRPDVAIWRGSRGESLGTAVWRLARSRGHVYVDLFPLGVVRPTPADDPRKLANAARRAIAAKIGMVV